MDEIYEQFPLKAASGKISALAATSHFDDDDQFEHTAALSNKTKLGRPYRKIRQSTGRQAKHLSKKYFIKHEDEEIALELNVQAYMEAEIKKMNSNKYAVEMKPLDRDMKMEHEQLADNLCEIEDESF